MGFIVALVPVVVYGFASILCLGVAFFVAEDRSSKLAVGVGVLIGILGCLFVAFTGLSILDIISSLVC